ncbi:MAG TPA: ABC transporter permease [Gaiellaceae bacterium]|jgi:ABC-2 type transport system permease protein|nr:ABC transporter permease [Gaiellaceae bacterium]
MTAITPELVRPLPVLARNPFGPLATLVRRRLQLSARTPRELVVPLLTPILFALIIAPALKEALHTSTAYEAFVATGTIGLLIPLNTMFAGIGVLVDRESGARRELLAAPIPRSMLVFANLVVAFAITALQIGVLIGVARARGIHFDTTVWRIDWFLAAASLFTIGMYGAAETLAARVPRTEEYIGRVPAIAIVPWFLAGSLFPITALPSFLTWFARILPLTHALALTRYGLLDDSSGLRDIWRMHDTTAMASLSLLVVLVFAAALTAVAIRIFGRTAVQ